MLKCWSSRTQHCKNMLDTARIFTTGKTLMVPLLASRQKELPDSAQTHCQIFYMPVPPPLAPDFRSFKGTFGSLIEVWSSL